MQILFANNEGKIFFRKMALTTSCQLNNRNCLFRNNLGSKNMEDNHFIFFQTSHASHFSGRVIDIETDEWESVPSLRFSCVL